MSKLFLRKLKKTLDISTQEDYIALNINKRTDKSRIYDSTKEGRGMIRELGTIVIAPVALVGYAMATDFHFNTTKHETSISDSVSVGLMTSETGLGAGVKATSNGLYGIDLQYGLTWKGEQWSLSFIPKLGFSATSNPVKELPQDVQFGLGAQVLVGYGKARMGLELWHLSNAGVTAPNIGLNLPIIQVGYAF